MRNLCNLFAITCGLLFSWTTADAQLKKSNIVSITDVCSRETQYDETVNPWPKICSNGLRQSPIDLYVEKLGVNLSITLEMINFDIENPTTIINITQNAYYALFQNTTAYVALTRPNIGRVVYKVHHFNAKWGSPLNPGSEHTYAGNRSQLEFQLFAYNVKYSSYAIAESKPDGMLGLASLVQEQLTFARKFDRLMPTRVSTTCKSYLNTNLRPADVAPRASTTFSCPAGVRTVETKYQPFLVYEGSLTTPPCTENVVWVVFPCPMGAHPKFINLFLDRTRHNLQQPQQTYANAHIYRKTKRSYGRDIELSILVTYQTIPTFGKFSNFKAGIIDENEV